VQDPSSSTYASISFCAILNNVVERVRVDCYGGEPFFTTNWKSQEILTFYKPAEPEAPLFDVAVLFVTLLRKRKECTSMRSSLF
jgi:hypothetical protein